MRYKVFCSNGHKPNSFYVEDHSDAQLLYNMAIKSGFFEYVELLQVCDETFMLKEWEADDGTA